jgi:Tetratricopeptide repeat
VLWHPDGHPVLYRAGNSLLDAGLHIARIAHWQRTAADAERFLGPERLSTLTALAGLAFSYWQAGRVGEAIVIEERVAAARERILGREHPYTLTAWGNLAASTGRRGGRGLPEQGKDSSDVRLLSVSTFLRPVPAVRSITALNIPPGRRRHRPKPTM